MTTSAIEETSAVRKAERTAARVIDGRAVVIVIDDHKVHALNEVGTRIWELADGRSLGEIVDTLVEEFEISREAARSDAFKFVGELAALGAVEVGAGA